MRVLVVDDDPMVRNAVRRALVFDGHDVAVAESGEIGLQLLAPGGFDLVVLDVTMEGIDGVEVARRIRAAGDVVPILMLTARDAVEDRVRGLDAGADDYVLKPFALDEFLARVRALARRTTMLAGAEPAEDPVLRVGDTGFDRATFEGIRGDRRFALTRIEAALLELLLRNPRRVMTREVIYEAVWGYDFGGSSNTHEVHISTLRRKLESAGEPRVIHTVRGVGYMLREDS